MKTYIQFKRYINNDPKQIVYFFLTTRFGVKNWWVNNIRYTQKKHYLKALKREYKKKKETNYE